MWKLIIFKHLHILLAVFFNCAQPAKPSCEPNLAHGPSASNLWFVYQRGVKGILAVGEWESLVANLSLKRKPNKTTMGRSPALGKRPSYTLLMQEAASMPEEPSYTRTPLITGLPCQSAIFSEARTLQSHFTNMNIAHVITGENTQTDCSKTQKNFWRK